MKTSLKNIFFFYITLFFPLTLFSDSVSQIFSKSESGIVYIQQSLFFKKENFKNLKLFQEIEDKYGFKIIEQYFQIGSGSGFLISKDGYILTSNHVIENVLKNNDTSEQADFIITNSFQNKIPENELEKIRKKLFKDIKNLLEISEFNLKVTVGNKKEYIAEIINFNKEDDIALLKIKNDQEFNPLILGADRINNIGDTVLAIGYPLQYSSIFHNDLRATMSQGNISSIRDVSNKYQHTATLYPGSSGGPLINLTGEIIGINVSILQDKETINFSLKIDKPIEWLQKIGKADLVQNNLSLVKKEKAPETDIIKSGPNIFINYEKKADIYINNEFSGVTPKIITISQSGESTIKIESSEGVDLLKILINNDISEIFVYKPRFKSGTGRLQITSTPSNAKVIINGEKKGQTPLILNELTVGSYNISLQLDGYSEFSDLLTITKNTILEKNYLLEKNYRISFNSNLPENTIISLKKENSYIDYAIQDTVELKNGSWELLFRSVYFEKISNPVIIEVNNKDLLVDFTPVYKNGKVILSELKKESTVFVDGADVTNKINNNSLELNYGKHNISISSINYKTITNSFELLNKELNLGLVYEKNFKINFLPVGLGLMIPGGIITVTGSILLIYSLADIQLNNKNDFSKYPTYTSYFNQRVFSLTFFWSGITGMILGVVSMGASIPFFIIKKQNKTIQKFNFNFNFSKDLNLYISLKT